MVISINMYWDAYSYITKAFYGINTKSTPSVAANLIDMYSNGLGIPLFYFAGVEFPALFNCDAWRSDGSLLPPGTRIATATIDTGERKLLFSLRSDISRHWLLLIYPCPLY